jgi:hypothetical protein
MTPPFSIGSLVEIIGPDKFHSRTFKITQSTGCGEFSAECMPWYPASSLRLVDEELKIGDWVQHDDIVFQIADISPGEPFCLHRSGRTFEKWYHPSALRKLTPEEVAMHTGTIGYQLAEWQKEMEKAENAVRKPLAPLVDERLSAIEKAIRDLQASHVDVGSCITDHINDTEKNDEIEEDLGQIFKRLQVLEGERPEVCQQPLSHITSLAAMASFGPVPECVAAFIRHETEEAEKLKLKGTCDEEDCRPFPDKINVSIWVGEEAHTNESCCPNELIDWCEKVLNAMRNGGA